MKKISKFIILTILGVISLIAILLFLQSLNIKGVTSISPPTSHNVYAGEGQTCSTPTFRINCSKGLTCADSKNQSNFDPRFEIGKCIKTQYVKKINSSNQTSF